MKKKIYILALSVIFLPLFSGITFALDAEADKTQQDSVGVKINTNGPHTNNISSRKAGGVAKLVNINGASRTELMKLPDIGKAEADRIIAGRPYATKAHLVTQGVISAGQYEMIRKLIVAKQPYKDGAKNAALYNKHK